MKLNMFKIKKWAALFLVGFMPTLMFFMFILFGYGLIFAIVAWLITMVLSIFLFNMIVRHPVLQFLEGEGLLAFTFDSSGLIEPFIAKVRLPFIDSDKYKTTSLFDRKSVFYMKKPKEATITKLSKEEAKEKLKEKFSEDYDYYILRYKKEDTNKITFAFEHFPVLIYNKSMDAFLTKDALAKLEEDAMIKHLVLYLKKKTEELTSIMRDFARHVVEMTKPKKPFGFLSSWWFWLVLIVVFVLLAMTFLPIISETLRPAISATQETVKTAVQTR